MSKYTKSGFLILSILLALFLTTQRVFRAFNVTSAHAAESKSSNCAESTDAPAEDVFLKTKTNKGIKVQYDCGVNTAKSDYCLIHVNDEDSGVKCYGLVSNAKVINPALSCVSISKAKK